MAVMQQYRGNEDDWDIAKMKPGQFAVSLDRKYVRMCFAPGVAERIALYDAFEEDMLQIQQILATCEDIQTAVEAFETLAEQHANDAAASATASANSATAASDSALLSDSWAVGGTGIRPGEDTNNAKYWCEQASAIANIDIATNSTVGIVKGNSDEIDIDVGGQMSINASFTPQGTLAEITGTENKKTLFGKIAKAVSDLIVHISNTAIHFTLTNNLLATVPGTALDATQGKILDDKITALGNTVAATVLTAPSGTSVSSGATASVVIPFTYPSGYSAALLASLRTTGANGLAVSAVLVSSANQNVTVTATNLTGSAVTLNPSVMLLFGK